MPWHHLGKVSEDVARREERQKIAWCMCTLSLKEINKVTGEDFPHGVCVSVVSSSWSSIKICILSRWNLFNFPFYGFSSISFSLVWIQDQNIIVIFITFTCREAFKSYLQHVSLFTAQTFLKFIFLPLERLHSISLRWIFKDVEMALCKFPSRSLHFHSPRIFLKHWVLDVRTFIDFMLCVGFHFDFQADVKQKKKRSINASGKLVQT